MNFLLNMRSVRVMALLPVVALLPCGAQPRPGTPGKPETGYVAPAPARQVTPAANRSAVSSGQSVSSPSVSQPNLQQMLGQYRQVYNQADSGTRNSIISPEQLQRMMDDPSSTNLQPAVNMYRQEYNQISPADRAGMITPDALQQMLNGADKDGGAAADAGPRVIGGDPAGPDFARGISGNTLDSLNNAAVDLDKLRGDPTQTNSNCDPNAASKLEALRAKAQTLQKGIDDVDQGAAMVGAEAGAGSAFQSASNIVGGLQGIKATADMAVGVFGALGGKEGEALSEAYKTGQGLVSTFGSIQNQQAGATVKNFTSAMQDGGVPGAALIGAFATDDPNEKAEMTLDGTKDVTKAVGAKGLSNVAGGASNVLAISKTLSQIDGSPTGQQVAEIGGNGAQLFGAAAKQIGTEGLGIAGEIYSAGGKLVTTGAKYNEALGNAFGTISAGADEKARLDGMVASNLQQIAAKRAHLVDLLNANQAQIDALSSCQSGPSLTLP